MKIRLLERDDIRRFGATEVDVEDRIAEGLIGRGRAVRVGLQKITVRRSFMAPPMNKAMWSPPEEKAMAMSKSSVLAQERIPKKGDNLFPKSLIL
jgi:hypothetical protein